MLRYGIPEYRLPRDILDAEIAAIERLGVEIRCGVKVGQDISFDEIRNDYDAIYVAIGAHQGKGLGIEGEEGPGIWTGTEFLNHVNSGKSVDLGAHVVIIGGGDTAIDAARVSKRVITDSAELSAKMGADVTILYRRTRSRCRPSSGRSKRRWKRTSPSSTSPPQRRSCGTRRVRCAGSSCSAWPWANPTTPVAGVRCPSRTIRTKCH
jgi:hypothetical protein